MHKWRNPKFRRSKVTQLKLIVPDDLAGERLDIFCSRKVSDRTRSYFTKLAAAGHISVDGKIAKPSLKMKPGMKVEIEIVPPPPLEATPEDIPLKIVYEDDRILIIDKPPDMVVHPAAGNYEGTLVNAVLFHLGQTPNLDSTRLGLVHRLDKDTSGLLVVAKDERALAYLQTRLKERAISRHYKALVWGNIEPQTGKIDLPIGRSERDRKIMTVNPRHGRSAVTHYQMIERFKQADLLHLKLETGRTHQIRVHLSHYGHPIIGDPTYGGRSKYLRRFTKNELPFATGLLGILERQALHAFRLELRHPDNERLMIFESELPDDFAQALEYLREK
ncbi:MAG TPA: RNA pseudouridine synthase [candidate division Zixibacteria bacterium]|nr:RNA pseudouridine synthase [candidate division Zixibacteria bacterium]